MQITHTHSHLGLSPLAPGRAHACPQCGRWEGRGGQTSQDVKMWSHPALSLARPFPNLSWSCFARVRPLQRVQQLWSGGAERASDQGLLRPPLRGRGCALSFAGERAQATEGIVRGLILNSDLGAVTCLSAYLAIFILKILNCTTNPFLYNHKDIFFVKQNSSDL